MVEKFRQCLVIVIGKFYRCVAFTLQIFDHRQPVSADKAEAVTGLIAILHAVAFPALGIHVVDIPSRRRMCPRDVMTGIARREGDSPAAADAPARPIPAIPAADVNAESLVKYFPRVAHASGRY